MLSPLKRRFPSTRSVSWRRTGTLTLMSWTKNIPIRRAMSSTGQLKILWESTRKKNNLSCLVISNRTKREDDVSVASSSAIPKSFD
ncbi:hypothetical protein AN958_04295 [Leucoagaricus sp. SymC.cos]|nr:hypothetical protein AN958_04295 [Leucoagaricus sp. SymC.cos]